MTNTNKSPSVEAQKFNAILSNADFDIGQCTNGALALTSALVENATAMQNYVNKGMMYVQEKIIQLSATISDSWIQKLQKDQVAMEALIQTEEKDSGQDGPEKIDQQNMTVLSSAANQDNTAYNTQTTTRNGYTDMLSQFTQNTNDTTSNNWQLIESGPISILQNMAKNL